MAEAALLLVTTKIGIAVAAETLHYARPLLTKKAGSVAELPANMTLIRNDLEVIQAFLKNTGNKDYFFPKRGALLLKRFKHYTRPLHY